MADMTTNSDRVPEIVNELLEYWAANSALEFSDILRELQMRTGPNSIYDIRDDQVLGALRGLNWEAERPQDER